MANPPFDPSVHYVWVDLDATLAHYERWRGVETIGDPLPGSKEFMEALRDLGHQLGFKVGIFTTRTKADMPDRDRADLLTDDQIARGLAKLVEDWLVAHGIPFHCVYAGNGKPPGLAYVDDRGVSCTPQKLGPVAYQMALRDVRRVLGK